MGLARVYVDSARYHYAIDPIIHQALDEAAALGRMRTKLADEATVLYAAEDAGEIVGLLELQLLPPPPAGSMLRPASAARVGVAVREDRRRGGVGTALMRFAERWAVEHSLSTMILDMSDANNGALRFYERLGYRTYGLMLRKPLDAGPPDGG
jgi:GNAT superfamily N-acetyltransferase